MIIPILKGILSWHKAPVTWGLLFLNVAVLVLCLVFDQGSDKELDALMNNDYYVETQGRAYAQYLAEESPTKYPPFLIDLADKVLAGDSTRLSLLGQLAFRDNEFLDEASVTNFKGDQVAFRFWKSKLVQSKELQEVHPSYLLGLNTQDTSFSKWVTYIFVHSGWSHLLGNMIFLLVFGALLETQIGGLALLVVFLLSGIFGAGVFALMTGVTTSPLVGASGSVAGVITLFCFLNWKQPVRFLYILFLPVRGYFGFVFLPSWVAFMMWFVADVAGYISSVPELGGIAHTAHIGGEFAGALTGLTVYLLRKHFKTLAEPHKNGAQVQAPPVGELYPLFPRNYRF